MKPRPFKFFFGLSIGIMVFFFLAKFVIPAFFIAAFLSVFYFIGRKAINFFQRLDWDAQQSPQVPIWKDDMLVEYPNRNTAYRRGRRVIEVV